MSDSRPYQPASEPPQFPHSAPAGGPQANRVKGYGVLIAVILGLCVTGMLVCCGGGLMLMNFGFGIMAVEIQDELATTPEFQEQIGSIESFELNWTRSFSEDDDNVFFYDVEGSKGSGYVQVDQVTDDSGIEIIESAELIMNDGRRIPISLDP